MPASPARPRRLLPLLAMVAVFAAPVVAAWFFYLYPQYLPAARSNRGELIEPVVRLEAGPAFQGVEGGAFDLAALAGKWTLVELSHTPCGDGCRRHVAEMGQVWAALGESRLDVERLLLLTGAVAEEGIASARAIAAEFPGLRVAFAGPAAIDAITVGLRGDPLGRTYIMDPFGRLMMRYAPEAPPGDVLKDMERLLKASKNWIKGAQYGHQ